LDLRISTSTVRRLLAAARLEPAETIRNLSMLGWIDVRASEELPVYEHELVGSV
jgi:hypothetical protein